MTHDSQSALQGAQAAQEPATAGSKRSILVVDDVEINRDMLELQLHDEYNILKAADGREALGILKERYGEISLMLLDLVMPNMTGEELLSHMQGDKLLSSVPVVVMTGEDSVEKESRCLELGASDFIRKPFDPFILRNRVRGLIRLHEADSALAAIERESLTGLYNREAFIHYARAFRKRHAGKQLAAVIASIVDFEYLAERFGEEAVAEHLRQTGKMFLGVADVCVAGYLGEGRFITLNLLRDEMTLEWMKSTMGELLASASIPSARVKFGIYSPVPQDRELAQVYRAINLKMQTIKQSYSEDYVVFGVQEEASLERRRQLAADMEASLKNGDFYVVFQPKHRVADGALCGAEALVRWNHPQLGPVSPGEFIPLFEENGFINQLDSYVHTHVYRMMKKWLKEGLPVVPVSANFSRRDLLDSSYIDYLVSIRKEFPNDVPAHLLRAEITESMLTQDFELLLENLGKLRSVDYKIELDDFGSGYSNLAALADLPIDSLKLDMSLVRTLDTKEPVVRHCIQLAHELGLSVVAEGVETREQLDKLSQIDCDIVQGYYFSRPLPQDEYVEYLKFHA
ncbi:MAG: EAL domain-containing protein [Coriobacteriales bacterium]